MSSAAIGAEDAMPRRRFTVDSRPATAMPSQTSARARTRERAPHLSAVPAGATVTAPAARPTRGTARVAASRPAAAKASRRPRTATMPRVKISAAPLRRVGRILYKDTVDGWILNSPAPSVREVFHFEYAVPGDWAPFRVWCKVWTRTAGTFFAASLDGVKWMLIHPVRGPLSLGGGGAAALTTYLMTH